LTRIPVAVLGPFYPLQPLFGVKPEKKTKIVEILNYVRFQKKIVGDVRSQKYRENTVEKPSTAAESMKNSGKKHVELLVRLLWRAVTPGLKPLRLPRARNEASSCLGIFSRTVRVYYVASSPGSPLPHILDGHRKLVGCSAIPARSCPGPVRYSLGSIIELEVPPDETPGLMTLHPHNTNVLQSITYAKSPYPPDRSNPGPKK